MTPKNAHDIENKISNAFIFQVLALEKAENTNTIHEMFTISCPILVVCKPPINSRQATIKQAKNAKVFTFISFLKNAFTLKINSSKNHTRISRMLNTASNIDRPHINGNRFSSLAKSAYIKETTTATVNSELEFNTRATDNVANMTSQINLSMKLKTSFLFSSAVYAKI